MAQADTIRQATLDRPVQDQVPEFLFSRTPSAGLGTKEAETTSRAAFGVPKRVSKTAHRAVHASGVPNCSRAQEENASKSRSRTTSRPIGERFMEGEEPAQSTAAQRSWVYSHDPVVKYHEEGVPVASPAEGLSVSIGDAPKNANVSSRAGNRRCRSITLEREPNTQRGTSVWIDFHVGPGET